MQPWVCPAKPIRKEGSGDLNLQVWKQKGVSVVIEVLLPKSSLNLTSFKLIFQYLGILSSTEKTYMSECWLVNR